MLQPGDNIAIDGGRGLPLGQPLQSGRGGEGMVFELPDNLVAKIYHQLPPPNTIAKLTFMIAHPPDDPERERGHASIAWPISLARHHGQVVGFLMPRAPRGKQLVVLLSPRDRKRWVPDFTWQGMLLAGRNLARAFQHIHDTGYVIGDVKPENIHVTDQSLVTILDTDSFQVHDPQRRLTYPCPVCTPGYTAPELLIGGIDGKARQAEQDAFALGVILYKLLVATDAHPFQGRWCGPGEAPDNDDDLVRNGWYTHKPGSFMQPSPRVLPTAALPPHLVTLLDRCFVLGHQSPTSRPRAKEWFTALDRIANNNDLLARCTRERRHIHYRGIACPWCQLMAAQGVNYFNAPPPAPPPWVPPRAAVGTTPRPTPVRTPRPPRPYVPFFKRPVVWGVIGVLIVALAIFTYNGIQGYAQDRQVARENAAKAVAVISRLEAAITARDKFTAEDILAELHGLVPSDPRLADFGTQVAALPGPKKQLTIDLGAGIAMELLLIRPGTFTMGSTQDDDAKPHKVTISKPFYMGKYAVTQEQWQAVMGNNPSNFQGATNPVENVSWNDCQDFITKVNEKLHGQKVSLPTEAQWEYACRAGTTTAYNTGDGEDALKEAGWYSGNSDNTTHPVGQKKPNAWGLYDMHGNVWQWCQDWYGDYPAGDAIDPTGPANGSSRVLRGGCWGNLPDFCRAAYRDTNVPDNRRTNYGFRLAAGAAGVDLPANPLPSAVLPSVPSVASADSKIAEFLSQATANDSKEKGMAALAALAALLKLDPNHAQARALQAKIAGYYALSLDPGMKLALVPPGTFTMGSPAREDGHENDETQHTVTISKAFYLGVTPVTQKQWQAVMGNNPSNFQGDDLPVETVSWDDAQSFCAKLSTASGKKVRLPTEAEWEYACRAGTTTAYNTGDGEAALGEAGWYAGNSDSKTHPVGQKKANAWGLYDMHGNVWQWCADWYDSSYPDGAATDPTGPASGSSRVLRGGCWYLKPGNCRAAYRYGYDPDRRPLNYGFRLAAGAAGVD